MRRSAAIVLASVAVMVSSVAATAQSPNAQEIARGKILVGIALCTDCHTPGYFFGKPDTERYLGGSEVGFEIPGLGVFHGPNLTPDKETGLGSWTREQIMTAFRTGKRPDGRMLAPIMPWEAFGANLTDGDANAIVSYLQSLRPVRNKVPGPFGSNETPTSFVFKVLPPASGAPPR